MYLGIDIGGTSIKFGILNNQYKIIYNSTIPLPNKSIDEIINKLNSKISELEYLYPKIESVGIGVPGIVNNGKVIISPNIPLLNNVNLFERILLKHNMPFAIDNDANAAAITELELGTGKKLNSFIYVTLGTGVGGAIINNREIFRGYNGSAGEIGHTIIDFNIEKEHENYQTGTLEYFIGRQGIIRLFKEVVSESINNIEIDEDIDVSDISEFADANECEALEALSKAGKYFGIGLSSAMNLLGIPYVIVGGGISKVNNIFYRKAIETIIIRALPTIAKQAKIIKARFSNNTGIIGSALLGKKLLNNKT